uniref:Uncharacterized protein n=1 Tax=Anopheles atroparvus TaxID=41427 RepID=A0AAG5DBJ7_ANOAO
MSYLPDDGPLNTSTVHQKPVSKKSHRVQVNIPSENVSLTEHYADKSESGQKSAQYRNLSETPHIGILTGTTAYNKAYNNTDDILKHLCVAYLCTILKPPSKWTPETFAEVVELESTIAPTKLTTTLPIQKDDKTYHIHLSSTLAKGRFNNAPQRPSKQVRLSVHQALARIQRGKAAIWTCDSHFFLIRRVQEGFYFYTMSLQGRPALMFFICHRLMVNFVQETYGCTERSKYFLSKVVLHSIEEDDLVRIVWKMKRCIGMQLEDSREAILHGNICLAGPSLERSLEIGLNVLVRAGPAQPMPRSWDNKTLNGCFKRSPNVWCAAEKIAKFLRDRNESSYSVGLYDIACRTNAIGHRQRKHFEDLVNYFLASCTALLVVGLDCCFLLWARDDFIHWFSPFRYSSLRDEPKSMQNRASFLHISNALVKTSQSLYEYLFELGVFPDHTVELLPMRVNESRRSEAPVSSEDDDSLDQEGFIISPASEKGWNSFYAPTSHSPSALRLARQMLDMVYRTAEDRCN